MVFIIIPQWLNSLELGEKIKISVQFESKKLSCEPQAAQQRGDDRRVTEISNSTCAACGLKSGSPQPRGCILARLVPGQAYPNGAKRKE